MERTLFVLLLAATPCVAQEAPVAAYPEQVFSRASELAPWCRQEAEARFTARGVTAARIGTLTHRGDGRITCRRSSG